VDSDFRFMLNGTRLMKPLKPSPTAFMLLAFLPAVLEGRQGSIDTTSIRAHTSVLAHDSLAGRGTGSPGAAAAARYIAAQCRAAGLEPLGDGYFLPFDLISSEIAPSGSTLRISNGDGSQTFETPGGFFPNVGRYPTNTRVAGPAVYVGGDDGLPDGAKSPEGAIAVTIGVPRGPALERLAARGFIAALHVPTNPDNYGLIQQSRGSTRWAHADETTRSSFLPPIPSLIIDRLAMRALIQGATRTVDDEVVLNSRVELTVAATVSRTTVNNVGCVRRGRDRTMITAFSAHYDHLGISTPDATGDSIYNGFSDNAAGVAMLLAIGEATQQAQPKHDLAFLFFTGEERGLLGSDAFVHNPPLPLDRFRAVINLDAGAPPGRPTTWRIAGEENGLRSTAVRVGESLGWTVTTSGATPNTDYYPFVRMGVPAIFVVPGTGPYDGMDQAQSDSLKNHWDGYHQAHDHWFPDFPFAGVERYARYAWAIAEAYRP
jgi:hypothetical protein